MRRSIVLALVVPAALVAQSPDSIAVRVTGIDRPGQPGDVLHVTVSGPQDVVSVEGAALGQSLRFYEGGDRVHWHALLGIDVETKTGTYDVRISAMRSGRPTITTQSQLTIVGRRFPTRRLRVAREFVNPPARDLERIEREAELLRAVFSPVTARRWQGPFVLPAASRPSSTFGARSVYNGLARSPHSGVDFGGRVGAPVAAPNEGTVVLADDLYFTGRTVVIDHGLGLYSLFAHLSRVDVAMGDGVNTSQTIGLIGATGRVTGPHLHWAVRLNGARVDPMSLVAATVGAEMAVVRD